MQSDPRGADGQPGDGGVLGSEPGGTDELRPQDGP
jgi:hypothetical protein